MIVYYYLTRAPFFFWVELILFFSANFFVLGGAEREAQLFFLARRLAKEKRSNLRIC